MVTDRVMTNSVHPQISQIAQMVEWPLTNLCNPKSVDLLLRRGDGLVRRYLDEELFERCVFQTDFSQRPAVLDDGSGDFFSHVAAVVGAEGGGDVLVVGARFAVEDFDAVYAGDARERGFDFARGASTFDQHARLHASAGAQLLRRALRDDSAAGDDDRAVAHLLDLR